MEVTKYPLAEKWIKKIWVRLIYTDNILVTQLCPTLCDPMGCSTPGLLVIINSWNLLKRMSIESVMTSNHLILCRPFLFPPSIFPSISLFKWVKSLHQSVFPMNIQDWFPLGWTGWISLLSKELWRVFSNTIVQKHQFFGAQLSL